MKSSGLPRARLFAWFLPASACHPSIPESVRAFSTKRLTGTGSGEFGVKRSLEIEAGRERICMAAAALVDTNILVYRFDDRFPEKQRIATEVLRRGILENSVRVPHQAIVEFIAAVTKPVRGHVILTLADAIREAEEFLLQFTVLYPNEAIVRNAIRGCVAYQLSWFDAHIWACAEYYGLSLILTEDFEHDRLYGSVRTVNPFVGSPDEG